MQINKDDFEIWRASPVAEQFFNYLLSRADDIEEAWHRTAWMGGDLRPELLADMRAMADVLRQIPTFELEDIQPEEDDGEQQRDTPG